MCPLGSGSQPLQGCQILPQNIYNNLYYWFEHSRSREPAVSTTKSRYPFHSPLRWILWGISCEPMGQECPSAVIYHISPPVHIVPMNTGMKATEFPRVGIRCFRLNPQQCVRELEQLRTATLHAYPAHLLEARFAAPLLGLPLAGLRHAYSRPQLDRESGSTSRSPRPRNQWF